MPMELEFDRDVFTYYERVAELTLCQEETLESIVPDACPDILRIVEVCGQAALSGTQARDGLATVSGMVRAAILYRPEEGEGIRRMEIALPFTCQAEARGLTEQGIVLASPRLRHAEARALNPRKVLLRVDLAIDVTACQPRELTVCRQALAEGSDLCQKQINGETYLLSCVQEKPFTFTDQVRLPGSSGEVVQLLSLRAQPTCSESRVIGNKLIFKGEAAVSLLCQEPDGTLTTAGESMPFSQIMEVPEGLSEGDCRLRVELADIRFLYDPADDRSVEVTLELVAQARIYCRRPLVILQDLYSTTHQTEVKQTPHPICRLEDGAVRPQSVRELLETDEPVRSVADCRLSLGQVTQVREGDQLVLTAEGWVTLLYLDESGQPHSLCRMVPVVCRMTCPKDCTCSCTCTHSGELYAVPSAGGAEVRFTVDFHCMVLGQTRIDGVCEAHVGEQRTAGAGERPSVVLRLATHGEGIWELAKAYGTTGAHILQANELTEEDPLEGRMLLIPSLR